MVSYIVLMSLGPCVSQPHKGWLSHSNSTARRFPSYLLLYFLFILYLPRSTLPDFPSVSSLASLLLLSCCLYLVSQPDCTLLSQIIIYIYDCLILFIYIYIYYCHILYIVVSGFVNWTGAFNSDQLQNKFAAARWCVSCGSVNKFTIRHFDMQKLYSSKVIKFVLIKTNLLVWY